MPLKLSAFCKIVVSTISYVSSQCSSDGTDEDGDGCHIVRLNWLCCWLDSNYISIIWWVLLDPERMKTDCFHQSPASGSVYKACSYCLFSQVETLWEETP